SGPARRTKRRSVAFDAWDVVAVPFPFSDRPGAKRRPAVILSGKTFNQRGHAIMSMITTKDQPPWPGDHRISDLKAAGLHVPCLVRLKMFTLDDRLVQRRLGRLSPPDRASVAAHLRAFMPV